MLYLKSCIFPFCAGLTVVTRSPDSNNVTSSAVGTALPKFAIRGMLKTFGLHGVVLDVDSVSKDMLRGILMHQRHTSVSKCDEVSWTPDLLLFLKEKNISVPVFIDSVGFGVPGKRVGTSRDVSQEWRSSGQVLVSYRHVRTAARGL